MFVRLSAAIAVMSLLSSFALAEDAKLTDPQISHIAYTAGVIDIAAAKLAELAKLNGADFDKAYVANEVANHKAVDSALETTLIPNATNAELKGLLQTGLKIFQGHEQHAEHVATSLK